MTEETVDALGPAGRVLVLAQMFEEVQRQLFTLEVEQVANGHTDADPVPGSPLAENGDVLSYEKRRNELLESEKRLQGRYSDDIAAVETYLRMKAGATEE